MPRYDDGLKNGLEALERACRVALEQDERFRQGWFIIGMLCLQKGDIEQAYESLSEFASLEAEGEAARKAEVLLYYLESLEVSGSALDEDLGEEMAEAFLEIFAASLPAGRRLRDPGGPGLKEAVLSPEGRRSVLRLLREEKVFLREAVWYARAFMDDETVRMLEGDDY